MKATELLQAQHREVERLFGAIEKAKIRGDKSALFDDLAHALVAHDVIERELFYPACQRNMGMTSNLGEALAEHGLVEFSLFIAHEARGGDDFDHKLTVLREVVQHHVKEEEHELFPEVEKAFEDTALTELGARMKARFDEVEPEAFDERLRKSLRRVLAGASTATAKPPHKAAAGAAAKKNRPRLPRSTATGKTHAHHG